MRAMIKAEKTSHLEQKGRRRGKENVASAAEARSEQNFHINFKYESFIAQHEDYTFATG
jgi:hypothetical protein